VKAQNVAYGVLVGGHFYDIFTSGDSDKFRGYQGYTILNRKGIPLDVGVFVDVQINESLGIKTNLFHSQSFDEYFVTTYGGDYLITSIQLQPALKIDANKEYGKGFYFLTGPRFSYILKTKDDYRDEEVNGFYKRTNYGIQAGFGFMFSRLTGFELRGDLGVTNMLESSKYTAKILGAYGNFFVILN